MLKLLLGLKTRAATTAVVLVGAATLLTSAGSTAVASNERSYLALGDSVVFGYIASDGYAYGNPRNFVGYPDYVGRALGLDTVNASCPGEATGGFLSVSSPDDNGCQSGYRHMAPLHVSYPLSEAQMDFATAYLLGHRNTKLVTLGIGANDAFILERTCLFQPACIKAGLPALLGSITANVDTILANIRGTGYKGVLMVVNYYSLDYSDSAGTGLTQLLNQAVAAPAAAHHAVVADAFGAFQLAAAVAGGNTCHAALLNGNPANQATCDVHPSLTGQQLLAQVVTKAYFAPRETSD
jgi:lysophospholipase L1-like esterase